MFYAYLFPYLASSGSRTRFFIILKELSVTVFDPRFTSNVTTKKEWQPVLTAPVPYSGLSETQIAVHLSGSFLSLAVHFTA
jgi:hypothetical protein